MRGATLSPIVTENLFDEILLTPAKSHHGGKLLIVSGYGTATMARLHMGMLDELGVKVSIELILGMTARDGITKSQHEWLCALSNSGKSKSNFNCRYAKSEIHAKTYLWIAPGGERRIAYSGSANYTITGFMGKQTEAMAQTDPDRVYELFQQARGGSADCADYEVAEYIKFVEPRKPLVFEEGLSKEQKVNLSLLSTHTRDTHRAGGLNWGQRKNRNPNQAYIPVRKEVRDMKFFPEIRRRFEVSTDDGHGFICAIAQQEGKGIHSPEDNSQLGSYFRKRIGVKSGEHVHRSDLENYGRTDVTFIKIDEDRYYMDFSVDES